MCGLTYDRDMAEKTDEEKFLEGKFKDVQKDIAITRFSIDELVSVHPRLREVLLRHGLMLNVSLVKVEDVAKKDKEPENKENGDGKTENSG